MITYSIIQLSQLEGATRFDAEYYQPEYLEIAHKLQNLPHEILENTTESLISFGAYALTSYINWRDTGIPFIVAENIKDGFIDYESVRYIDEKADEILKKSRVQEGQVLLAMSGSVGNAAVAVDVPPRLNSNQDIVKITLKKGFSPYFLAAFLNSKYGKMQVLRLPVGSVQQHIFLWQTKTILVPTLPDGIIKKIEQAYKAGLEELNYSKSYYQQAENLLLEELGLRDFKAEDDLYYIVDLSDTESAHRNDPDYFQPKYKKLINKLGKNVQPLNNIGRRKKSTIKLNKDINYRYIEISDIDNATGEATFNNIKGSELPANAKMLIEGEELIISKVRPTRGAIAIIPEDWHNNYVASSAFSIFQLPSPTREYLQVTLRSIVGRLQLVKPTTGTSYPTVTDQDIENLVIPILPLLSQQKIADLVRKSHDSRIKSKELLETAKRKVEEMIEN